MKSRGREILGKAVVSEESGRKYGLVGDLQFVAESGELLNLIIVEPTRNASEISSERDSQGRMLLPFSCVKSVGDFIIISEKELT